MTYTIGFIAAWARQNCSIDAREVPDASISRAKAAYYLLLDSLLREAIEPVSSLRRVVMAVSHGGTDGIHVQLVIAGCWGCFDVRNGIYAQH